MSEEDTIRTLLTYNIEMGDVYETFTGKDATSWFWNLMDAIKKVIEDWNIKEPPRQIRITVRREADDRGPYPWMTVTLLEVQPLMPWIDLDALEQRRDFYFMIGQATGMAWRNIDAKAIVEEFK